MKENENAISEEMPYGEENVEKETPVSATVA